VFSELNALVDEIKAMLDRLNGYCWMPGARVSTELQLRFNSYADARERVTLKRPQAHATWTPNSRGKQ
jgi:hypothetical protein